MKRNLNGLMLAVVFLVMPSFALADTKVDLHSRYDTLKAAMAAHDGAAIQALLTPDFKSIDVTGQTENTAQMIAEVEALKPDPNKTSRTTLLSVAVSGSVANVEQRYEMNTQKVGTDGQIHAVKLTTQSHDIWNMSGANWLISSTQTEQMDYAVDGKVVMHKSASH